MSCSCCHRDIKVVARGLCNACYQRWRKNGTTTYLSKGVIHPCSIGGCDKKAVAKGLCDMHRQRLNKHGHTDQTRPDSWGAKDKHPLNHVWQWLMRTKDSRPVCEEWNDFLQFISDVGERPGSRYKLWRTDESIPIGPSNFYWRSSVVKKKQGESTAEYNARYQRIFRKLKSDEYHGYEVKRNYKVSPEEYRIMLDRQGGKCAICYGNETVIDRNTKKPRRMALDHCHSSGRNRGLLCTKCNNLLGHAKDSIDVLQNAIEYLNIYRSLSA